MQEVVCTLQACTQLDEWKPYFCAPKQSIGKPLRIKYSCLQKSGLCMCTMKPFADPGPEQNAKFASCSYNGHTAAATARAMRQLLPVCIRIPPPWIIHISLMLRVQCHATPGVTCHVSRAEYEVYTRSRHSAIPPQPSQRPQPGHLSKTSSNLIQFMCCGKIRNHKWKASDVFKKQSYPGWCIVNAWVWKLQARWRYQAISGINYVSVWLDNADSVACGNTDTGHVG